MGEVEREAEHNELMGEEDEVAAGLVDGMCRGCVAKWDLGRLKNREVFFPFACCE